MKSKGKPTQMDVAKLAFCNHASVSNVINGKNDKVSPELAKRIRLAIQELGYVRVYSRRYIPITFLPEEVFDWMIKNSFTRHRSPTLQKKWEEHIKRQFGPPKKKPQKKYRSQFYRP